MSDDRQHGGTGARPARGWRRASVILAAFGVLAVAVIIALPLVLEHLAERWLRDNGAPEAAIGNVDLNLFTGVLRVADLQAGSEPGARLSVRTLEANVDWSPLVKKRARLRRLAMEGAVIDVRHGEDGTWQVGAVRVPAGSDEAPADAGEAEAEPWGLRSVDIELGDVVVSFAGFDIDTVVKINMLRVGEVATWLGEQPAELVVDLEVEGDPLRLTSKVTPFSNEPQLSGRLGLEGIDLADHPDVLALGGIRNPAGRISTDLDITLTLRKDTGVELRFDGSIEALDLHAETDAFEGELESLRWEGEGGFLQTPQADEDLVMLRGTLELGGGSTRLAEPAYNLRQNLMSWDVDLRFRPGTGDDPGSERIEGKVAGRIEGLRVHDRTDELTLIDAQAIELADAAVTARDTAALGRLSGKGLRLLERSSEADGPGTPGIRVIELGTLLGQDLRYESGETVRVGTLGLDELAIDFATPADGVIRVADVVRLELAELEATGTDTASLGRLDGTGVRLLSPAAEEAGEAEYRVVALGSLAGERFGYEEGRRILVETLSFDDLDVDLVRQADGTLKLIGALAPAAPEEQTATQETAAEQGEPFTVAVSRLEIGGASSLRFTDQKPDPDYRAVLDPVTLTVSDIDTGDPAKPMQLDLAARQGEYTSLSLTGALQPFAEQLSGKLDLEVRALELGPFSPYVSGFDLKSGRLSTDSTFTITADEIDAVNEVVIDKLRLTAAADAEGQADAGALGMPLDVALDLLRDADGRIKLTVPMQGNVNDPQFGTGAILRTATQKAVQKAALSYAKFMLQPFGAIMFAGEMAGKATRPRFEPVAFAPAAAELGGEARKYLDKLAGMLRDRPGLQLTVCGVATASDREALIAARQAEAQAAADARGDKEGGKTTQGEAAPAEPAVSTEELLELADARGQAVRGYLRAQHDIGEERLYACRSVYEAEPDAAPRVEITL